MTDLLKSTANNNQTLDVKNEIQERLEQELTDLVPRILREVKGLQESIVEDDLAWYFHKDDIEEDRVDTTVDRFMRLFKGKLISYIETKEKSNKTIDDYEDDTLTKKEILDRAYDDFLKYEFSDDEEWFIDREDVELREDYDGTEGEVVGFFTNAYGETRYEYIDIEDLKE